jgi:hypothetical protein
MMKKLLPFFVILSIFFIWCSSNQTLSKSGISLPTETFVIFPFEVEPPTVTGSEKAVSVLQDAFIKQVTLTNNRAVTSNMLVSKIKELNMDLADLDEEKELTIGKALNGDIVILGVMDYKSGPESDSVEPNFKLLLTAVDVHNGQKVWESSTGRLFNWASDSENIAMEVSKNFLEEFVY